MTKSKIAIEKGDLLRIDNSSFFRDYQISEDSIFMVVEVLEQDNLFNIQQIRGTSTLNQISCIWIDDNNIIEKLTDEEADFYSHINKYNL